MRHRFLCLIGLLALIAAVAPTTASARNDRDRGPALQTPLAALQQALKCSGDLGGPHDPVLLVHGTFADSAINWSWNYVETLPTTGRGVCTVDLPDRSAGDAQVSSEYVVHAIRAIAKQSGGDVDVIGHSQGGLQTRWALRWWPDVRDLVSDVVMLGTPNHGSAFPDAVCTGSVLLRRVALPDADRIGVPDRTQRRQGDRRRRLVHLDQQRRRPDVRARVAERVEREAAAGQRTSSCRICAPAMSSTTSASRSTGRRTHWPSTRSTTAGPADPSRVDTAVCETDTMPGVTRDEANAKLLEYAGTLQQLLGPNGPKAEGEPPLAGYTDARPRARRLMGTRLRALTILAIAVAAAWPGGGGVGGLVRRPGPQLAAPRRRRAVDGRGPAAAGTRLGDHATRARRSPSTGTAAWPATAVSTRSRRRFRSTAGA